MAFLNTKITGNGLAQTAITNDAILEAVVNSLVAFNTTGGALNFSVLINDSVLFTESVAANDTFRIPDKINVGASSTFKVTADTGVDVSVSYLQQAIDTAGALSAAQIASQAAQTAATSAATSYDNFDDRYLGSKATDPTLDNDGAALLTGALYFNTTSSGMKVYDGAAWQTAYANLGGVLALTGGTMTGAVNIAKVTIASHATTADIWTGGNLIDWTGTAVTTAFPAAPQAGADRTLICAGACSFTAGANMLINGVASGTTVVCEVGDQVTVIALSTTQFRLNVIKITAVAAGASFATVLKLT